MAKYSDFIKENTALLNVRRIGIYDTNGNRVGQIPLGTLTPPIPEKKLYTFGAISDVHLSYQTGKNDFINALTYLKNAVDFICICGDFTYDGTTSELAEYKTYIDNYAKIDENTKIPVYAIPGNHENYPDGMAEGNIADRIKPYTGQKSFYSFSQGNDVFIMVGIHSNAKKSLFNEGQLQWLYEQLEANRNRRCFIFIHPRPDNGCGDALKLYGNSLWGGDEKTIFESLMKHYHNCIIFHGHTHMRFSLQEFGDTANYDKNFGCHSVHISSLAAPREDLETDGDWDNVYADSEGYVVDVYENGIHLRGRDFVRDKFLPIASYWLDTTLVEIPEKTYYDETKTIVI